MIEFLLLYQQSVDTLKYEYEDCENFKVRMFTPAFSSGWSNYDGGILVTDNSLDIQYAYIDYVNLDDEEEKNTESILRFVAAMCALEYSPWDYDAHDLLYKAGLTEHETVFDETMALFDEHFDTDEKQFGLAMAGKDILLYEGKNYTYYLQYGAPKKSEAESDLGFFYIYAIQNK